MGVEVQVTDSGATGLAKRLEGIAQALTIGVHEDAKPYEDGTPAAEVGSAQEFGTVSTSEDGETKLHVPERSWLRGYFSSGGDVQAGKSAQLQVGLVVDGAAPETISEEIGDTAVTGILARMSAGIPGQRRDGTTVVADLKKSGHLRDSIKWEPTP